MTAIITPTISDAVVLHRQGDLIGAERIYLAILARAPDDDRALHLLGVTRQQQGRHEEALNLIGQAIAVNPAKAVYHGNYGAALLSLERFAEAKSSFRRALAIRPNFADAWANLGMAESAIGDVVAAEESLRQALLFQPGHRDATSRLAGVLGRTGRSDEAIRLLESAIAAAPCPQFHSAMGNMLSMAGEAQRAAEHYRTAIFGSVAPRPIDASSEPQRLVYDGRYAGDRRTNSIQQPTAAVRRVAVVSPHCVLDFTNGAATATLDMLKLLQSSGIDCELFCGTRRDAEQLESSRRSVMSTIGPFQARMFFTSHGAVPVTMVDTASRMRKLPGSLSSVARHTYAEAYASGSPAKEHHAERDEYVNREEIAAFIAGCEMFLTKSKPDVVWTYGGDPLALVVQQIAKQQDIPIVFALHNLSYTDLTPFQMSDRVVVPTEFAQQYYKAKLGLETVVFPPVLDAGRVDCGLWMVDGEENKVIGGPWSVVGKAEQADGSPIPPVAATGHLQSLIPSFHPPSTIHHPPALTFVNPTALKGIFVFARVAEALLQCRPDIRLMVVEGVASSASVKNLGIDLTMLNNVSIMPNTPDARQFLNVTKLLLVPSLIENAAMVAREAMLNGIPVIASTRGALPETIGDAGILIDIPPRYTPETREMPNVEEVAPWIDAIIRLWNDPAEYERYSRAARQHALQWHPERLGPVYSNFFSNIGT